MREVGARGIGALKGATVVVVAEEEWAVAGIELCASSCAGVAFLLFELEESRGVPRPKDRPTADAPTTVAVAQSVGTVFILVRNHTAGEDSLGEALVTTRAFWHVKPQ
jgi:hypothetical protein